ncbi:STAS domain-containing protein [Herbidospora daliensis]|uniref:STAS domain-containing protein n=1 Tax=Herbidospora daliensis TaxID=295585 RepID=UPI0012FA4BE4|nr:STAS domain-containing protein [Herbidospora daliensis]
MTTIILQGDLDVFGAVELRRAVWRAGRAAHLRLDLAKVTFIDVAGARTLLWAHRRARGRVSFANPPEGVLRLLRLLDFDRYLEVDTLAGDVVPNVLHVGPAPYRRGEDPPSDDSTAGDPVGPAGRETDPPRRPGPP